MISIENQIVKSISNHRRGKIFFPGSFMKFGRSTAVRQALNRLEDKGFLIRLAKGIYLYPKTHKLLGILFPTLEEIAIAIAKRDKARIIPTGNHALNKLGLSTQIPLNIVYLTDGSTRKISIYNGSIKFKRASPKLLSAKNEIVILVIQALRELGVKNIDIPTKKKIKTSLAKVDSKEIQHDLKLAPAWIKELVEKIIIENERVV